MTANNPKKETLMSIILWTYMRNSLGYCYQSWQASLCCSNEQHHNFSDLVQQSLILTHVRDSPRSQHKEYAPVSHSSIQVDRDPVSTCGLHYHCSLKRVFIRSETHHKYHISLTKANLMVTLPSKMEEKRSVILPCAWKVKSQKSLMNSMHFHKFVLRSGISSWWAIYAFS